MSSIDYKHRLYLDKIYAAKTSWDGRKLPRSSQGNALNYKFEKRFIDRVAVIDQATQTQSLLTPIQLPSLAANSSVRSTDPTRPVGIITPVVRPPSPEGPASPSVDSMYDESYLPPPEYYDIRSLASESNLSEYTLYDTDEESVLEEWPLPQEPLPTEHEYRWEEPQLPIPMETEVQPLPAEREEQPMTPESLSSERSVPQRQTIFLDSPPPIPQHVLSESSSSTLEEEEEEEWDSAPSEYDYPSPSSDESSPPDNCYFGIQEFRWPSSSEDEDSSSDEC